MCVYFAVITSEYIPSERGWLYILAVWIATGISTGMIPKSSEFPNGIGVS